MAGWGDYTADMSITGIVENNTVKLPLAVPDGTRVEVTLPATPVAESPGGTFAERYAEFIGIADDLPADFAMNHDHYLHGARKRE
jgi:hypothetical protein